MTIKCILHTQTGLCVNIIDDPFNGYVPPDGYSVAPDNTGQFYWYWDGDNWNNPSFAYYNAYLGETPSAQTQPVEDESERLATTFYVRQKIEDYIQNVWLPTAIIDGGKFTDAAIGFDYDAGNFNNTGGNLTSDQIATDFTNTGGNLSNDINGGTF